jgi:hypothetical protein
LSHQLKQYKIDGEKTIIQNPTAAQRKEHEKCDFEKYEVYAMDVLVSSGEGQVSRDGGICILSRLLTWSSLLGQGNGHKSFNLQEDGRDLFAEVEGVESVLC